MAQLYTTKLANSWPTNLWEPGFWIQHKHVDGETKDSYVLDEFQFAEWQWQCISSVSSWQGAEQYQLGWVLAPSTQDRNSTTWRSWLRANKNNMVIRSTVPFHSLDDNNQLNWNPFYLLLTWESFCFSSLSSQWSNQETASWWQDSGFGYAHGGSAGKALTRQINSVVRRGSAEVQTTAVLL